jgi:hypothetical protein
MPDGLEYLVRPYQTPNAQGAIIIPATPVGAGTLATLTWSGVGSTTMPQPQVSPNSTSVQCCDETQDELSRETELVRITQQGEPENYVDVARSNKLHIKRKQDTQSHCIPDVVYFAGPTFSDGFEPQDDSAGACKITFTLKNNTTAPGG